MEFTSNYLEVDVNGEETFIVNKEILTSFCGKLSELFGKSSSNAKRLKLIFNEFPGGAECFELTTRFCYNNGSIGITPFNIVKLNYAASLLEMNNLVEETENLLREIGYWTWSELIVALKQCQSLNVNAISDDSLIIEKVLDCIVIRLAFLPPVIPSPLTNFSSDTISTCSMRSSVSSGTASWFEELSFLNLDFFVKLVKKMVSQKLDHTTIFKFLVFYTKSSHHAIVQDSEKYKATEVVMDLLLLLDRNAPTCKGIFEILRIFTRTKTLNERSQLELERLIGTYLDQATINQLLLPSPERKRYVYDVDLVLRLVKSFLLDHQLNPKRLKIVANLIELYIIEVAADNHLKPSKFASLLSTLPDSARASHDKLYFAIDIYLQVHDQIHKEEKLRICSTINYNKVSPSTLNHLSQNSNFPSRKEVIREQNKLSSLIENHFYNLKNGSHYPFCYNVKAININQGLVTWKTMDFYWNQGTSTRLN